ncbi:hypothetical protein GCM10008933_46530 [Paenibacillus motobuensis]|uniref:DUF4097 domain-containing protein n=2 Tax=Paenibacillus motobuensis TaxID=295324 RepID=A0ABP3IQ55_9BACL
MQIPVKQLKQMSVTVTNGNISAKQLIAKEVYFKSTNGNIVNRNLSIQDQYKAEIVNGNVTASDITSQKLIEIKSSNGNIKLERAQAATIDLGTRVGGVEGTSLAGEVLIHSSTGNLKIDQRDINLAGSIQASTNTGKIDIALRPEQSVSLLFTSTVGIGDVSLEGMDFSESSKHKLVGKNGDGKYKIQVDTATGNFKLHE